MVLTLLCGCQDSNKYPTEGKESPSQTEEQVLWPSYEQANVLSDGSLAFVDLTHKDDGYICARLLQEVTGIKLQMQKDDKKYNYDFLGLGNYIYKNNNKYFDFEKKDWNKEGLNKLNLKYNMDVSLYKQGNLRGDL